MHHHRTRDRGAILPLVLVVTIVLGGVGLLMVNLTL